MTRSGRGMSDSAGKSRIREVILQGAELNRSFESVQRDVKAVLDRTTVGFDWATNTMSRLLLQGRVRINPSGLLDSPSDQERAASEFSAAYDAWLDWHVVEVVSQLSRDRGARWKKVASLVGARIFDDRSSLLEWRYTLVWFAYRSDTRKSLTRLAAASKIRSFFLSKKSREPNYAPTTVLDAIVDACG